jgi:hypothetical protein
MFHMLGRGSVFDKLGMEDEGEGARENYERVWGVVVGGCTDWGGVTYRMGVNRMGEIGGLQNEGGGGGGQGTFHAGDEFRAGEDGTSRATATTRR